MSQPRAHHRSFKSAAQRLSTSTGRQPWLLPRGRLLGISPEDILQQRFRACTGGCLTSAQPYQYVGHLSLEGRGDWRLIDGPV